MGDHFQTYEEFRRLAKKTGYRIFYLNNSNNAEDQFGPKSSQKFGYFFI